MSDQEINIAIAEVCGWRLIFKTKIRQYGRPPWKIDGCRERIPDYCNDLNAIHEAEKMLTEEQCVFVRAHLHERLEDHPASRYLWHATARERAKAFLRVIGKWKEDAK